METELATVDAVNVVIILYDMYKIVMTEKVVKTLRIIPKADVDKFMKKIIINCLL